MTDLKPRFKTEEKEIDGRKYSVTLFPAGRGFELLFEFKNLFGDSIGSLFGGEIETAISKLGGQLSKTEALEFVRGLLELTFVEGATEELGKRDHFDEHFSGRYSTLLKVIAFVMEANFSDFFAEIKIKLGSFAKTAVAKLKDMGATDVSALSKFLDE